ncbi:uncharacterized protein BX663DRAFT_550820 [Cokeromyces recurvatus]|uniref:uncharacterized protein n=1 Tax=Cokeromyces recurvatus TaxID=90255 RepID=UPI00221E9A9C|nr:uncharacterized protein BX663DRAFT_550820 [Cokeromyces recurvatus]KAI7904440.1 hypothetical protein BX663DRAFT_550820 [Cokeromyces recurvatus]
MSFQSILTKKIWRSQRLFAKLCLDCLSKRSSSSGGGGGRSSISSSKPLIVQISRNMVTKKTEIPTGYSPLQTNMIQTPVLHTKPLDNFRRELYQSLKSSDPTLLPYSSHVKKTILRRQLRKRLLENYQIIKKQSHLVRQLTQQDMDRFIAHFTDDAHPDDPLTYNTLRHAFYILADLKSDSLSSLTKFRLEDAEKMIYLASELGWDEEAEKLLTEAEHKWSMSMAAYDSVFRVLSKKRRQDRIDFWLSHLKSLEKTLTRDSVRSVIMCMMFNHQLQAAAEFLKINHPSQELTQLIDQHESNSHELLDKVFDLFALDCLEQGRLNEMRLIYMQKRQLDMSTRMIVKHLVTKCIYTGKSYIAENLLTDTLFMKDISNAQFCARKLIHWNVANTNIENAIHIWEKMEENKVDLPLDVIQSLIVAAAKKRHHVDTMRLYKKCQELYPGGMSSETRVYVFRSIVLSRQYNLALELSSEIESILPYLDPNTARLAVRTLFRLCSHTGELELFERVFRYSETLGLSLTHRGLTSLISCYISRGDIDSAKAAFQSVATHTTGPDVVDFNLLLRIVAMEDNPVNPDKVYDILDHMKLVNVAPDETTLRTMLAFYSPESDMHKSIYDSLLTEANGSRFDQVFLNNIALMNLLKRNHVGYVTNILLRNNRGNLFPSEQNKPIVCNDLTFKILLDVATKDPKYANIAEKLFKSMRTRGFKPPKEVYENLIYVVSMKGRISKARQYITQMENETGIKADERTYMKLVNGLLRLNKPDLAKDIIMQDMVSNDIPFSEAVLHKLKYIESIITSKNNE